MPTASERTSAAHQRRVTDLRIAAIRQGCVSAIEADAPRSGVSLSNRAWLAQSVLNILDGRIDDQLLGRTSHDDPD